MMHYGVAKDLLMGCARMAYQASTLEELRANYQQFLNRFKLKIKA